MITRATGSDGLKENDTTYEQIDRFRSSRGYRNVDLLRVRKAECVVHPGVCGVVCTSGDLRIFAGRVAVRFRRSCLVRSGGAAVVVGTSELKRDVSPAGTVTFGK